MESLNESLARYHEAINRFPEDARFLPEDGICGDCSLIVRNNPAVEKLLAIGG